ncbi:hypothetical protein FBY35_0738 [Streptomyces sp. SLBN-118]|uniref:hypothetical protein n=1 Tax=Streptomyces sp. SLBN-118 TaxID=2768454 RepID=UPI001152A9CE|nr:hypothetical protein [Streptomyces sp. SLBN-118]TQK50409.1 hypothetical protein FBY35_0738 [Streptomyces sp. SLBN-118]
MTRGNEQLRRAVTEAGCSYAELARDVRAVAAESGVAQLRTNSSAVAHWIAGTQPGATAARILAETLSRKLGRLVTPEQLGLIRIPSSADESLGLDMEQDPVDALIRLGRADIERRTWISSAPYSVPAAALPVAVPSPALPRTRTAAGPACIAGEGEIRAVREMTTLFTAVDERHGGQHGRSAVVQYLVSDVATLCRGRFRTETQKQQMLSAAACVAYLAGWKAYDAGEAGLAQRYYLQALKLTRQADLDLHTAFVLRILAHHGLETGRGEHTLDLIDAALRLVKGRTDPATESLYVITRARALALAGRSREAVTEAARAARLVDGADESEMPFWAALWGSAGACVGNHTAKSAELLGHYDIAERHFSRAVWSTSGCSHQRITALSLAHAGSMQCRQGHVEQACTTWHKALELMDGVRSARVVLAARTMRRDLAPFAHRGSQAALDFDERARLWLAGDHA